MRLFAAINFNSAVRAQLFTLQGELRSRSSRGNFTVPENLHLTLVFIGECSPKNLGRVDAILETIAFKPFDVSINRLGTFSRGTLWWAGLREDRALMALQHEIEHKLAFGGFEMDGRKYNPHITLGREVITDAAPWRIEPFGETVTRIDLMKSEHINGRLTYTAVLSKETVK